MDEQHRIKAWAKLIEHLRAQKPINGGRWTREELYERTEEEKRAMRNLPVPKGGKTE